MTKEQNMIKTNELICTSQSWDGARLPDFPQGQPELRVIRLDFPVGTKPVILNMFYYSLPGQTITIQHQEKE